VASAKGLSLKRARYNDEFWLLLASAEARFDCGQAQLEDIRDARLLEQLHVARRTVPAYSQLPLAPADQGLDSSGTDSPLDAFPVLTKEDLQRRSADYQSNMCTRIKTHVLSTGGTTGTGLKLAFTPAAIREQWAVWWRYRRWHGIEFGTWCAHFGGHIAVIGRRSAPPFWRYDVPGRRIYFSTHHLNESTVHAYLHEIRQRKVRWVHGHPSLLSLLSTHMLESSYELEDVRWVTTGAEMLLPEQRSRIELAFGVQPRQHYGLVEGVANISECEIGSHHIDEDFGYVEFLPSPIHGLYRLIGTNLSNRATILVRYDTGDLVRPFLGQCPCGRPGRLVGHVEGRGEDFVVALDGGRVGPINQVFSGLTEVREGQVVQEGDGRLVVLVVPGHGFGEHARRELRQRVLDRVGVNASVEVRLVENLQRSTRGKLLPARGGVDTGPLDTM